MGLKWVSSTRVIALPPISKPITQEVGSRNARPQMWTMRGSDRESLGSCLAGLHLLVGALVGWGSAASMGLLPAWLSKLSTRAFELAVIVQAAPRLLKSWGWWGS